MSFSASFTGQKDIILLEYMHARCLSLCKEETLSLPSLEYRRIFTDLCEVYKYTHYMYKNGLTDMFSFSNVQLRGHSLKLDKRYCRSKLRQSFFSERIVDRWNSLPETTINAPSLQSFKENLKRVLPQGEED